MAYFKAKVEILVECASEVEAADALSEGLRDILQEFAPGSSIIDWRYCGQSIPEPHNGEGFEYATPVAA